MNHKLITVFIALFIIYILYKFNQSVNKKQSISDILNRTPLKNPERLNSYSSGYLKAWSDAVKSGSYNFQYKGKVYDSQNGRAV